MFAATVLLACAALLAPAHAQFNARSSVQSGRFGLPTGFLPVAPVPARFVPVPVPYSGNERLASTKSQETEVNPDGSYRYYYNTDNGISAEAEGAPRVFPGNPPAAAVVSRGSFSWTSPEGNPIAITYTADENGYQPQGDAIPTPPPVPEAILRSLEFIARSRPRQ